MLFEIKSRALKDSWLQIASELAEAQHSCNQNMTLSSRMWQVTESEIMPSLFDLV